MVLAYITAEDAFGPAAPDRRGPRPLQPMPATVSGLYDHGMRHHERPSVLSRATGDGFEPPRLAARPAGHPGGALRPGEPGPRARSPRRRLRAALVALAPGGLRRDRFRGRRGGHRARRVRRGPGGRAARGGAAGDLRDRRGERQTRAGLEPGRGPGRRVRGGRGAGRCGRGLARAHEALDLGGTLDTPERAQGFRAVSRSVPPDSEALWHAARRGRPVQPRPGDGADRRAPPGAAGAAGRRGLPRGGAAPGWPRASRSSPSSARPHLDHVGREGRTSEDVVQWRPHKLQVRRRVAGGRLRGRGPRWPAGLDRGGARRRLQEVLGDRLRSVETDRLPGSDCLAALGALGAHVRGATGVLRETGPLGIARRRRPWRCVGRRTMSVLQQVGEAAWTRVSVGERPGAGGVQGSAGVGAGPAAQVVRAHPAAPRLSA